MDSICVRLDKQKNEIFLQWLNSDHNEASPSYIADRIFLKSDLPHLLTNLSQNLEAGRLLPQEPQNVNQSDAFKQQRGGLSISQLVREYAVLRLIVMDALSKTGSMSDIERSVAHETFDQAIAVACQMYLNSEQNEMKSALATSEASNRALDQFSMVVAHDLKSPLATIRGFTDLLIDDLANSISCDSKECLKVVSRAASRMSALVDRILSYSRLNSKTEPFTTFELGDVLKSVLENLSASMSLSNATVEYKSLPIIAGDQSLILQLLQNLIANSIKYRSLESPVIQVNSEPLEDGCIISVIDNGRGFDPRFSESVFDLHKQLDYNDSGLGVGLATCKKIVDIHNGQIWCTSTVGNGAKFSFTLPGIHH